MEVGYVCSSVSITRQDVDLHYLHITVRDPKGGRERKIDAAGESGRALREHLHRVKARHEQSLAGRIGSV